MKLKPDSFAFLTSFHKDRCITPQWGYSDVEYFGVTYCNLTPLEISLDLSLRETIIRKMEQLYHKKCQDCSAYFYPDNFTWKQYFESKYSLLFWVEDSEIESIDLKSPVTRQ